MPVSSSETTMYSTVQIASEPRMPIGRSRCGLRVSSAAVETASKPRYAKKIVAAPVMNPTTPKCVPPPPPKPSLSSIAPCRRTSHLKPAAEPAVISSGGMDDDQFIQEEIRVGKEGASSHTSRWWLDP